MNFWLTLFGGSLVGHGVVAFVMYFTPASFAPWWYGCLAVAVGVALGVLAAIRQDRALSIHSRSPKEES